jgi:hypothetical protein
MLIKKLTILVCMPFVVALPAASGLPSIGTYALRT